MKNKKTLVISAMTVAIALAVLTAIGAGWQSVHAKMLPTAVENQTSFGTVGITVGQTMRVSVANTLTPSDSTYAPPCRVLINFRDITGNLIRNRSGEVIFRTVQLDPGQSAYLDLNFGQIPSVVGSTFASRVQLRPVITIASDSEFAPPCIPVAEVFDSITGRTQFVMTGLPAVQTLTSTIGTN